MDFGVPLPGVFITDASDTSAIFVLVDLISDLPYITDIFRIIIAYDFVYK